VAVILIVTDGIRPDSIEQANTPHFDLIMREGAFTLYAQSLMPTVTLPCHMTIFHSVPAERHGILSNDYHPLARPLPGLYEQINKAGLHSAAYYTWDPLRDLSRPLCIDHTVFVQTNFQDLANSDRPTVEAAARQIQARKYNFTFLHLGSGDEIGHLYGWMSDEQIQHVEILDEFLGQVLDAMSKEDTLIVHSDHGGHGRTHGTDSPEDMTIPWMAYGNGIRVNYEIQAKVSLLNTAPTIAHILNVEAAPQWEGTVLEEIFV
jgi:predicted AlkP superfamily pyrophosphatase or phosphodiesterase